MRSAPPLLAVLLVGLSLSGCVAAIPLVAAAAITKQQTGKGDKSPSAPAAEAVPSEPQAPQSPPAPAIARIDEKAPLPIAAPGSEKPLDGPYGAVLDFAKAQLARIDGEGLTNSVMLEPAPALDAPRFLPCGDLPPAVMIDLDAAEAPPVNADPGLIRALAALRSEEVAILWVTRQSGALMDADGSSAVTKLHDQLVVAALDPERKDSVTGLRTLRHDRIQLIRDDLGRSHCVIALIGDQKPDMHELFAYLRMPEAAFMLDKYWGAGWFLLPPPLPLKGD